MRCAQSCGPGSDNNHFQSVVFGGVLLTTEKTEDFEWAFSNFVELMGGVPPTTILTGK